MSAQRKDPALIAARNAALIDALTDALAACQTMAQSGVELGEVRVRACGMPLIKIGNPRHRLHGETIKRGPYGSTRMSVTRGCRVEWEQESWK